MESVLIVEPQRPDNGGMQGFVGPGRIFYTRPCDLTYQTDSR
jgi:hypothetical protein